MTTARDSIVLVIVNLDPIQTQTGYVEAPIEEFGEILGDTYEVHDLLTDTRYVWHGKRNYVALHPGVQPPMFSASGGCKCGPLGLDSVEPEKAAPLRASFPHPVRQSFAPPVAPPGMTAA